MSCNDVDYRTQRQHHVDWAAGEAIHDYTDPDGDKVIPLYPGDDIV